MRSWWTTSCTRSTTCDRLETERGTSTARALAAQEGERQRIAQELHDEIGQSLTAVLLELKRAVDRAPDELRDSLSGVQEMVRVSLDEVRQVARKSPSDDAITNNYAMTFTPDGKQLFLCGYGGKSFRSATDLNLAGSVDTGVVLGADILPGVGTVVTERTFGDPHPAVSLFPPGGVTPSRQWNLPDSRWPQDPAPVAWEPGGGWMCLTSASKSGCRSVPGTLTSSVAVPSLPFV